MQLVSRQEKGYNHSRPHPPASRGNEIDQSPFLGGKDRERGEKDGNGTAQAGGRAVSNPFTSMWTGSTAGPHPGRA